MKLYIFIHINNVQLAIYMVCLFLHKMKPISLNHLKHTIPSNSGTARMMIMVIIAGRMMPATSRGKLKT